MTLSHRAGPHPTWSDLLTEAAACLGDEREARWMIEEASGERWTSVLASEAAAPELASQRVQTMVARRRGGEPLQYVLGSWAFRTLDLMVDQRVLIPRPETEQVVEVALAEIDRLHAGTVVDLGTGSGAIALSIAAERKGVEVWATDSQAGALEVARANLSGLGGFPAARVRLVESDWWAGLPETLRYRVDLVVSNPPYIATGEMEALDPVVREWEPRTALEAGPAGTEAIEAILGGAPGWLRPGGVAVLEIAPDQRQPAERIAVDAGFAEAETRPDLSGRPRVLVARASR